MKNSISIVNAQLLVKEETDAIKTYKNFASMNTITRRDLVTFEQFKFKVIIAANQRKLDTRIIKALASRAGVYNVLQAAGFGMRTHAGFVPSQLAIQSRAFIVGHYEHSNSATFKVRPESADKLVDVVIAYAATHPEVALSSKQANTRLLQA